MPPAKPRAQHEESGTAHKEKASGTQSTSARGRRNGTSGLPNGSSSKGNTANGAEQSSVNGHSSQGAGTGGSGLSWTSEDTSLLTGYRNLYGVDTPTAFKNPVAEAIFTSRGIGKYSPTWATRNTKRRVNKKQLALAVRKNFNSLAVNETEVIVDMLYKVKVQDKALQIRFGPPRKQPGQ